MTAIVINRCWGGFGLSPRAVETYLARKGQKAYWFVHPRVNGQLDFETYVPGDPGDDLFAACYTDPDRPEGSYFSDREIPRDDTDLVTVVRELGAGASGRHAELAIVEIPDDVEWQIEEYDGREWVSERHRTWS